MSARKPARTGKELFAEVVELALADKLDLEDAADMIGDAVAKMTADRLDEIGLRGAFHDCVWAIRHVTIGIAAAKLVVMKKAAEYGRGSDEDPL